MSTKDWAIQLLDYLRLCNWSIPNATISNQDPKLWSELWKKLFKLLNVDLLVNTAYHPQTDGPSKCTNQTIKIAFRYMILANPDATWHKSLSMLQSALMNLLVTTTGLTLNQILYWCTTRDGISLLSHKSEHIAREDQRALFRLEAADAINFVNAKAKLKYNKSHTQIYFKVGDKIYLQLHRGYTLAGAANKKLSNQWVRFFEITQKIR